MSTFLLPLVVFLVLVLWYAIWGRVWLKTKPWAAGFFAWIEPIEIALYRKSETVLWARIKMLTGATLAALTSLGQIDITPLMPFVPDKYEATFRALFNLIPLLITVVGAIDEKQRNQTTKPVELVALPDKVIADNPEVARLVSEADDSKNVAVAVATQAVADAKAA